MTLIEKRQEKGRLWEAAKQLNDKAQADKRAFTAEETQEWERLTGEIDRLDAEIRRDEQLAAVERQLSHIDPPALRPNPPETGRPLAERVPTEFRALAEMASPDQIRLLEQYGHADYPPAFRAYLRDGYAAFQRTAEQRQTLQADVFTKGGALVPPLEFIAALIKGVDDEVFLRQWATRFTVIQAEGVGVPTLEADPADADWTSELATGNEGSMTFGKRELRPHPVAKRIKVSKKLMRSAAVVAVGAGGPVGIEQLVRLRLAYKFGITFEKAALTGDGVQKPLGVFTAHADGIPTSRDVSSGNTATAIGADNLFETKYSIKAAYWPRVRALFHRDALKAIRKLKDGNGQYLWQPGLQAGQPDRVIDTPYAVSEYAPNTFTTGLYVGIFGDFSWYWIVDALDLTVERLVELYAEQNQVGFIGRLESDGAPVLAEAFARMKLA